MPLNVIADVLGSSATTVGRRLQQLQRRRLVRVISTVHWSLITSGNPYVVWIRCEPGRTEQVATALQAVPEAQSILITTGDADIHCTIYPLRGTDSRRLLSRDLPSIPGVASLHSELVLRPVRQGIDWRIGRLSTEQASALSQHGLPGTDSEPRTVPPLSTTEFDVLRLLFDDGRISAAQVARELGLSRSTAYRVIQSLLDGGAARPRVEVEPAAVGFPVTALCAVKVQPQHIPSALDALSRHPSGRFTVMVAGSSALIHHGVFRGEDDLASFVTDELGALPGVRETAMSIALGVLRRQWIDREQDVLLGERRHDILARRTAEGTG